MWKKLEHTFIRSLGPSAITDLHSNFKSNRLLITIAGDQLTGKSSLSNALKLSPEIQTAANGRIHQRSTGQTMRELAAEKNVSIGELSNILAKDTNNNQDGGIVDINLDYRTIKLILGEKEEDTDQTSPSSLLILEGRQPAVMATYCTERIPSHTQLPFRVYLKCSVYEQAIRYIDREISASARIEVEKYLPPGDNKMYPTMEKVLEQIEGQHFQGHDQVIRGIRSTMHRDQQDQQRFDMLYGKELNYRNTLFYDLVVDTSNISSKEKVQTVGDAWIKWIEKQSSACYII